MIVVADTSPINYLVLIGHEDILAHIYRRVIIPQAVFDELNSLDAPIAVQKWLATRPTWLEVNHDSPFPDATLDYLGRGERDAIVLAQFLKADRLIVDEGAARREATKRVIPIIGILGLLLEASRRGLLDLAEAIQALQATSFYMSDELVARVLALDRKKSL